MTKERWQQIDALFEAALDRPPEQRAAFLEAACGGDAALRREVEALLASDEHAGGFMAAAQEAVRELAAEDPAPSLIGRRIGSYQIVREIGRGGMGAVYWAERTDGIRKPVAIKVIKRGMDTDAILRRFRHEQQILAALDHPNIAKFLDAGTTAEGQPYVIMDYVEGQPLDQYCDAQQLSIERRLELFCTVCAAVEYAHQQRVIHRDLKPSNILVTADGVPKLLDFGIAKALDPEQPTPTTEAQTAGRPLTPEYASPEQVRGEPVTPASDVYSLGVLLYELLTGHRPYRLKTRTPEEIVRILCEAEPERPSTAVSRVEEVPSGNEGASRTITPEAVSQTRGGSPEQLRRRLAGDLDNIVLMALRKEPERRYASVVQFSEDIRRHLDGLPIRARQDRFGYRMAKFLRRNKARVLASALIALLVLALVSVGFYEWARRRRPDPAALDSIAVLPLVNAGGDPNMEYLSDGLTESLINRLSQVSSLKVMAYSAILPYKGQAIDPQSIGEKLKVGAVLTGRMVPRGEELLVRVELVDARDNRRLWGEEYQCPLADLVTVPEGIAREVSDRLQRPLSREERQRRTPRDAANSEAYQLYLRGRYLLSKRTGESMTRSIEYFERAIEKDPNFASAYAVLGECYSQLPGYTQVSPKESGQKARTAALKALAMDDRLAEAHAVLAAIHGQEWNWPAAEKEFRRALELNPNYATTHGWYALYLARMGRHEEGLAEIHRALALDPFSPAMNLGVGRLYYYARQYDQAIQQLRATPELDPNWPYAHSYLARTYEQTGQYDEAMAEWLTHRSLVKADPERTAALKEAYAASGIKGFWRKQIEKAKEDAQKQHVNPVNIAKLYAKLGETEEAFKWLEKAYTERDAWLSFLKADPEFDRLHDDPRWADLLRRMGLPP